MIVPGVVRERGAEMSDEEIIAACVEVGLEVGLEPEYGEVIADFLKGRHPEGDAGPVA